MIRMEGLLYRKKSRSSEYIVLYLNLVNILYIIELLDYMNYINEV